MELTDALKGLLQDACAGREVHQEGTAGPTGGRTAHGRHRPAAAMGASQPRPNVGARQASPLAEAALHAVPDR